MNTSASHYLSPELAVCKTHITSKKKALEAICDIVHRTHPTIDPQPILESLIAREKLGTTAIGEGIAVPHGKLCYCQKPLIVILTLDEGIDFDAVDKKLVDILVAFIIPKDADEEHLHFLSKIAQLLKKPESRVEIRNLQSSNELYQYFSDNL